MSSLYKRIQSSSIKYGDSFVISGDTEEETVNNLNSQKKLIQKEIEKAKADLAELKQSLSDLFNQKDSIIDDAKKSAEEIKTKAILNAEEIIAEANKTKADIENEATIQGQKQGFEAGYNDAHEQFKKDFSYQIKSLETLVGTTFEIKNEIVFSAENEIAELALLIAEKIEGAKFDKDVTAFKNMTQKALSLLNEKENIKIIVNPKLVKYAEEISPEIAQKFENLDQIKIIQDKTISPDGAIVESTTSRIDSRISTQMDTLARTLISNNIKSENIIPEIEEKITAKLEKIKEND